MQVLLTAVLVHAAHAALEDAEIAFNGIRVDCRVLAGDILAPPVRDRGVVGEIPANILVKRRFVRQPPRLAHHVSL